MPECPCKLAAMACQSRRHIIYNSLTDAVALTNEPRWSFKWQSFYGAIYHTACLDTTCDFMASTIRLTKTPMKFSYIYCRIKIKFPIDTRQVEKGIEINNLSGRLSYKLLLGIPVPLYFCPRLLYIFTESTRYPRFKQILNSHLFKGLAQEKQNVTGTGIYDKWLERRIRFYELDQTMMWCALYNAQKKIHFSLRILK